MKEILPIILFLIPHLALGFPSLDDIGSAAGVGKIGRQVSAGADVVKAVTLDDKEVNATAAQYAAYSDKQNRISPAGSAYAERLNKLTSKLTNEDGLKLNFKVYEDPEINAFALANGTIRVNSGLLDAMTDEEALYVIGHEIGHVKLGHSKAQLRTALLASAARKAATTSSGIAGQLSASELGSLGEELVNAQFSQSDEKAADDYGLRFMKRHGHNQQACVTALQKIAKLGGESSIFSTHPAAGDRAARLQSQINSG